MGIRNANLRISRISGGIKVFCSTITENEADINYEEAPVMKKSRQGRRASLWEEVTRMELIMIVDSRSLDSNFRRLLSNYVLSTPKPSGSDVVIPASNLRDRESLVFVKISSLPYTPARQQWALIWAEQREVICKWNRKSRRMTEVNEQYSEPMWQIEWNDMYVKARHTNSVYHPSESWIHLERKKTYLWVKPYRYRATKWTKTFSYLLWHQVLDSMKLNAVSKDIPSVVWGKGKGWLRKKSNRPWVSCYELFPPYSPDWWNQDYPLGYVPYEN